MQSLVYKDLLNLKKYMKTLMLLVVFYIVISFNMEGSSFLSGMIVLVSIMIPIASFSYDQQSNFDLYAQSLPVTRKDIVSSKYVLAIGSIFLGTVLASSISFLSELLKGNKVLVSDLFASNLIMCSIGVIFSAIIIPLIYKFGVERARILLLIVVATPALVVALLPDSTVLLDKLSMVSLIVTTLVTAVISVVISYFISVKIYTAKDF